MRSWIVISASVLVAGLAVAVRGAEVPDYRRDVMPILTRYCAGCHNDEDREGNLSVLSLKAMVEGGDSGPALIAGQGDRSRLIQVLTGEAEPAMPPEDEEQLSAE